jgi:glycosyltransferase involved in cell wall biosynthesis
MVIDKQKVCVIVPFYNEEQVINKVVSELLSHNYKVLAVDDGSSDKSYENIQDLKCTIIRHPQNFGQGAALQTGMSFAKLNPNLEIFVTFDSDGQHQVANIENVLNPLIKDEADIVFGTRFQDDLTKFTFLKRLILKMAIKYTHLSTGVALTDTHNGFRAMNRIAINKIELNFPGMTHASEFVAKAGENNLRIKEVPVHVLYTKYSKRKGQSLWNAINILTDLFLR